MLETIMQLHWYFQIALVLVLYGIVRDIIRLIYQRQPIPFVWEGYFGPAWVLLLACMHGILWPLAIIEFLFVFPYTRFIVYFSVWNWDVAIDDE